MSKSKWGNFAYKGKPDPMKIANRVMFIFVLILFIGFVKAGLREGWFEPIIDFILY
ncbi:hypothetical protein KAJ41_01445 [Candidatus Parcubacteria bacterium]|nr:hypothetical protein [Candidatus Parcubacteria bacterium]